MRVRRHADVAGRADVEIEPIVGADGEELPAMRLVLGQIAIDDLRLRRVVEMILDVVDLGDLRQLGDIERAVVERDAVGAEEPGEERLRLALAVLVGDRIDLVGHARADEHGALVADAQRARVGHAAGIDLDLEILGRMKLRHRQFVGRGRDRQRRHRRKLGGGLGFRRILQRRIGGGRRQRRRRGLRRGRGAVGRLLRRERPGIERQAGNSRKQKGVIAGWARLHGNPPEGGRLIRR